MTDRSLVVALVAAVALAGCTNPEGGPDEATPADGSRPAWAAPSNDALEERGTAGPLTVTLRLADPARMHDGGVNATLTITASEALERVRGGIAKGDGLKGGRAYWRGELNASETRTLSTVVEAEGVGAWRLRGWAEAWVGDTRHVAEATIWLEGDNFTSRRLAEPPKESLAFVATLEAVPGNESTELVGSVYTPEESPDTVVRLALPEGAELLDGPEEEWTGAMAAGETREWRWIVAGGSDGTARLTAWPDASVAAEPVVAEAGLP